MYRSVYPAKQICLSVPDPSCYNLINRQVNRSGQEETAMRSFRGGIRHAAFIGMLLVLLLRVAFALGDVSVSFTPAAPRAGDNVDVTVTADGDVKGVRYRLSAAGQKIFQGRKNENRIAASFRPRKEGVYTLEVTVTLAGNRTETASAVIPVSGTAPVQRGGDVLYSQKDGWWHKAVYSKDYNRTLESSGCAVFAVSHALQRLGIEDDAALPDRLAYNYHKCYIEGVGTGTEALVTQTGLDFGFETAHEPVRAEDELFSFLKRGDLFCLGIVKNHVVLADGIDEESRRVHIVDSAPGATFSKLKPTPAYIRDEDNAWRVIRSVDEIPGIRWYFETSQFGGAGYWLDLKDCAARGMRLIRRPWLSLETEEGNTTVSADWFGTVQSSVVTGGKARTVPTDSLSWFCDGTDSPRQLAVVTKERATLTRRNGEAVSNYLPIPRGRVLAVLRADGERVYVYWRGTYGYLKRADVELTGTPEQAVSFAVISAEGKQKGSTVRGYREADAKSGTAAEWPAGTEVAVLERADGFCLAEGLGCRGWIPEKALQWNNAGE